MVPIFYEWFLIGDSFGSVDIAEERSSSAETHGIMTLKELVASGLADSC